MHGRAPRTAAQVSLACLCVALAGGCTPPQFDGPQIQAPPAGFSYDANSSQARNVFPEREMLEQGGWWQVDTRNDEHSSLFITRYPGAASADEVRAARDGQEARYGRGGRQEYGPLLPLGIDGRTAWSWTETQYDRAGQVVAHELEAVVSYDTVTFALEFYSSQDEWLDPDRQRDALASFGVGSTEVHWNLFFGAFATFALLGFMMRRRATRLSAGRSQYRFAQVPTPPEPERDPESTGDPHTPPPERSG